MEFIPVFKNNNTIRIWDDYFYRTQKIINKVNPKIQDELLLELKSHIYESMINNSIEDEVESLLDAFDKMGKPEEFLRPAVAERLLSQKEFVLNPKDLILATMYQSLSSIKLYFIMAFWGLGYFTSFMVGMLGVLKIFFPNYVGMFFKESGEMTLGITDYTPAGYDPLGYWFVPAALAVAFIIYFIFSWTLRKIIINKT